MLNMYGKRGGGQNRALTPLQEGMLSQQLEHRAKNSRVLFLDVLLTCCVNLHALYLSFSPSAVNKTQRPDPLGKVRHISSAPVLFLLPDSRNLGFLPGVKPDPTMSIVYSLQSL